MPYQIGNGIWNGVFAVPNTVADDHLKMASGLSIKVLLLLLRHGGELKSTDLSILLGQSPADIQDALNYWQVAGILAPEDGEMAAAQPLLHYREVPDSPPAAAPAPSSMPSPQEEDARKIKTLGASRRRMTTAEINELAEQDENIAYLLQETQAVLGKPLTPVSTDVVVALYSYYEMQPDLILMLIHYCVSIGKDSMRYVEKVAADWLDKGINTHERAEAEIRRQMGRNSAEGKIKAAFGIYDRHLVESEKKYVRVWLEDFKMDIALITLAFERAVELKGKLSFAYINGILSNWHEKGITTTVQAMQEIRDNRETRGKSAPDGKGGKAAERSSYDIGELEQMITYGDIL